MTPFYRAIAWLVLHIHDLLKPVFGSSSAGAGAAWALSIVLLTVAMRLLLFPLFVKQTRNMRTMQLLQPKMKELQAKYKNDKEKLNQEMMALWKEAGANPFAGCLPIVVQIPVFFALFRVLNSLKPNKGCTDVHAVHCFAAHYGLSAADVHSAATAKIFGVPISAAFNSTKATLHTLTADPTATKVLTAVLVVLMAATTFWTQRQLMARNQATSTGDNQMAQQQKILLYIVPFTFFIFGYRFPLGVLLYWLTTNLWSMGQQHFVIARMTPAPAGGAAPATAGAAPSAPAPGAKPTRPAPTRPAGSGTQPPRRNSGRNRRNRRGRR